MVRKVEVLCIRSDGWGLAWPFLTTLLPAWVMLRRHDEAFHPAWWRVLARVARA